MSTINHNSTFATLTADQLYNLATRLADKVDPLEVQAACDAVRTKPKPDGSSLGKRGIPSTFSTASSSSSTTPSSTTSSSATTTTTNTTTAASTAPTYSSEPPIKRSKKNKQKVRAKKRPFDHTRFRQRHVALRVAYIGINYHGFAIQDDTVSTVELHLYRALEKTCLIASRNSCKYSRCGRTDTGVSALGQVVGVWVRSKQLAAATTTTADIADIATSNDERPLLSHEEEMDYAATLNRVLPEDIQVIAWCPVPDHFSARFSCSYRLYRYYFAKRLLNLEKMKEAGLQLQGRHDYRNFCKMDAVNVRNYEREVLSFDIRPATPSAGTSEDLYYMEFKGTAFLWHQVRDMVAVLFLVGAGKESPDIVPWLLDVDSQPRKPLYDMASELPLVLYDCGFQEASFTYSQHVVQKLLWNFEHMWNRHVIRGMLCRAFADGIVSNYNEQCKDEESGGRSSSGSSSSGSSSSGSSSSGSCGLRMQECDYEPLLVQTKSKYQSLKIRQTGMSYEERVNSLSERKLALRNFHDERKIDADANPNDFANHRREAAVAGLAKERKA